MRGEPGAGIIGEQQRGLRGEQRVGLAERGEHRIVQRARRRERLGEVEERRGALLAEPHAAFTPVPAFFLALVLMREMMLVYGAVRVRLSRGRVSIRPRFEGKASTAAIFLLLLVACLGAPRWSVWTLVVLGAPFVVVSGVRYVIDGHQQMRREGASGAGNPRMERTPGL